MEELLDQQSKTPLYVQLKEKLIQELSSCELKINDRFPTIRKISEKHGISSITVSRAISELVNEGILYCRQGKGTFIGNVDKIKRISAKDILNIGLTFLDMYDVSAPYLSEVIKSMTESCNRLGFNLQIFATHLPKLGSIENPVLMRNITKKNIHGLIIASRMNMGDILMLREKKVPFVWVNNDIPNEKLFCVLIDNLHGVYLAINHLLKLGHKRIGFIQTTLEVYDVLSVYKMCLEMNNIPFNPDLVKKGEYTHDTGYRLMQDLLNLSNPPTAVFIIDDIVALGAMKAIDEKDLKIPNDIAMVGYANYSAHLYSPVSLTTIDIRVGKMCEQAMEMLVKVLTGEVINEPKFYIMPELVIRESCGAKMYRRKFLPRIR